jgi:Holliday junction resolvase
MTEAEITKKAVKALRKRGHFAVKIHGGPSQPAGLPDIVACVCGHFVGIEMKAPGKEANVTERQKKKLRDIKAAKGVTSVETSVEGVVNLAERIEEKYERN